MTDADRLSAVLAEIRDRAERAWDERGESLDAFYETKDDVPRLLAAVEAVLTLADALTAAGAALGQNSYAVGYTDAERQIGTVLREDITRALLGKDGA